MDFIYNLRSGMEGLEGEFDHTLAVLKGTDELVEEVRYNLDRTPDAAYAEGVLKLHDVNFADVAGNESFLDMVKKTGDRVKEFVMNLIRSIHEFFFGKRQKAMTEVSKDAEAGAKAMQQILTNPSSTFGSDLNGSVRKAADAGNDELQKEWSKLEAGAKAEAEKRFKETVDQANVIEEIKEMEDPFVDHIKQKIISVLNTGKSAAETIHSHAKHGELTMVLNDEVPSSQIDLLNDAIGHLKGLKTTNLTENVKWLCLIAKTSDKELVEITARLKTLATKVDPDPESSSAKDLHRATIVVKAYAQLNKVYQDVVIVVNKLMQTGLEKARDKLLIKLMRKNMKDTAQHVNEYNGINPTQLLEDYYTR